MSAANRSSLVLSRGSLVRLGRAVVPHYPEREAWFHRAIAEAIEGAIRWTRFKGDRGGYPRVVISIPPQHGKSLHCAELGPAFALGQEPGMRVLSASYSASISKRSIRHCRQWMKSPGYSFPTRYGSVDLSSGRKSRGVDQATYFDTLREGSSTPTRGYYMAQGMGGSITGWGYDGGFIDDLIPDAEAAQSVNHHSKMWDFYTSVFDSRVSPWAFQVYLATRWLEPDFADELIEYWNTGLAERGFPPVKVLRIPAIFDPDLPWDQSYDPRSPGDGLWHFYGDGFYRGKRAELLTRRPWVWHATYQQNPSAAGVRLFDPSLWLWYDPREFDVCDPGRLRGVDLTIDAGLKASGASHDVIEAWAWGYAQTGMNYFGIDEERGSWDYDQLKARTLAMWTKLQAAMPDQAAHGTVWVEDKANGPALVSGLEGSGIPFQLVPKIKSKLYVHRVAQTPLVESRVWLPSAPTGPVTIHWVGDASTEGLFVHELAHAPKEPNDRSDAFSQFVVCREPTLGNADPERIRKLLAA